MAEIFSFYQINSSLYSLDVWNILVFVRLSQCTFTCVSFHNVIVRIFNAISDGRKSFPINHGKTSDDTLLEVSAHLYMVFIQSYIPCNVITVLM